MPFVSTQAHAFKYAAPSTVDQQLSDIRVLLEKLRQIQIAIPLKKRMLVHGIWEVAKATGGFYGRYRSEEVTRNLGVKIQRDHIFKKQKLVEQLLSSDPDIVTIIERAQCCIVTVDEHRRLHEVDVGLDGWDRYNAAGIAVFDMADKIRVV